jgi:hypothetical protein
VIGTLAAKEDSRFGCQRDADTDVGHASGSFTDLVPQRALDSARNAQPLLSMLLCKAPPEHGLRYERLTSYSMRDVKGRCTNQTSQQAEASVRPIASCEEGCKGGSLRPQPMHMNFIAFSLHWFQSSSGSVSRT